MLSIPFTTFFVLGFLFQSIFPVAAQDFFIPTGWRVERIHETHSRIP
jgi:hypothetical protein